MKYDTSAEVAVAAAAAAAITEVVQTSFSTVDPHEDEFVLGCYPFPIEENESVYHECCGEVICQGCSIAQKRTRIIGTNM